MAWTCSRSTRPPASWSSALDQLAGGRVDRAQVHAIDGHAATSELVERARAGDGPAYLICTTYRFHGHHAGDPLNYREKEEVERWRLRDPIERVKRAAVASG